MTDSFGDCLDYILLAEGGYSNRKADRGGPTNYGVTQHNYDAWLLKHRHPVRHVKYIEMWEVRSIYDEGYWEPVKCRLLGSPMDLVMFDSAIQHGPGRAAMMLQEAVGTTQDGKIGPKTLTALTTSEKRIGRRETIQAFMKIREAFYAQIIANDPTQEENKRGWANRVRKLMAVVKATV